MTEHQDEDRLDPDDVESAPDIPASSAGVNLMQAMGGKQGMADGGLPGAVFVTVYTVTGQNLSPALWSALAVAGVLTGIRLVRRQQLQFAIAGLVGVAISAFIASRTGSAKNFFLPGLFLQAGYATLYLVSVVVGWPIIGVIVGPLIGEGMTWRSNPGRRRAYATMTLIWCAMFAVRLAVQLPLYLLDKPVALGYVKLAMGWPLVALAAWLSYLVLRAAPPPEVVASDDDDEPADEAEVPDD